MTKLILLLFMSSSLTAWADVYQRLGIEAPKVGDVVCQAYVSEFGPFSAQRCGNGCSTVILPKPYCVSGRGLRWGLLPKKKMRVAAVGDFFHYQEPTLQKNITNTVVAETSLAVCKARASDQSGRIFVIPHLQKKFCQPNARIDIYRDGELRNLQVQSAWDFHIIHAEKVDAALPERVKSPQNSTSQPHPVKATISI